MIRVIDMTVESFSVIKFNSIQTLKDKVDNDMKIRLATLNEFTSKIVTNNEAIKRLIMSDVRTLLLLISFCYGIS